MEGGREVVEVVRVEVVVVVGNVVVVKRVRVKAKVKKVTMKSNQRR
jgi:hypothetical protein